MSQENVDLTRDAYDAWNRRDMDAMLATFHHDLEFVTSGTFLGLDAVYRGHDGFRRFWREFPGAWESILITVQELRDCGERVLALITFEAQGRGGLNVRRQEGSVFDFRDGLAVRIESYGDWAGAREAAGLR